MSKSQEYVDEFPVAQAIPYAKNAKLHTDAQLEHIMNSIRRFDVVQPIVVDEANVLVIGHGRAEAAKRLGKTYVPAYRLRGYSEAEIRALRIADNTTNSETGFDLSMLRTEVEDIAGLASDVSLHDLGIVGSLEALLGAAPAERSIVEDDPDEDEDDEPTIVTRLGDVWKLGPHRIVCGDSTDPDIVRRFMGDTRAEMVFTDPPYGVNVKGGKNKAHIAGDLTQTAIPFGFEIAVQIATGDEARFYFCGGEQNIALYSKLFERYLAQIPRHLVWVKNGFVMKPNGYHNQYELIFYGYKAGGGGMEKWFAPRTEEHASDVWRIDRDPTSKYEHPTQKPVALAARAIGNSCSAGGLVYDPFLGSGSTLLAAEQLERVCYGLELEPRFVDVAVRRWQRLTGLDALSPGGQTFNDVELTIDQANQSIGGIS